MEIREAEFIMSNTRVDKCPEPNMHEYAFIGRSNVGKSSLINMLTDRKSLAKISGKPGKTQTINHFIIDQSWYLVDLPGYGYAKVSKKERSKFGQIIQEYILNRVNLINLFVLIDCRHEPQKIDLEFMEWLGESQIPFSIVFTKADKLSSSKLNENLKLYKKRMLEAWEEMPTTIVTSAASGLGKAEVLGQIDSYNRNIELII